MGAGVVNGIVVFGRAPDNVTEDLNDADVVLVIESCEWTETGASTIDTEGRNENQSMRKKEQYCP